MEKTTKPVGTNATATKAASKPAVAASNKELFVKNLKATEKVVETICEAIKKTIISKGDGAAGVKAIGGLNKQDLMSLITILDTIGSTTYPTACALRDIQGKMAD